LKTLLSGGLEEREVKPLEDGLAAFEAGNYEEAMPLLVQALKTDPHHVQALIAVGRMHLDQGSYAEAYQPLRSALELDIKNAVLNYLLGELSYGQGDFQSATNYFTKAVTYDPDYTDAHIRLGMLHMEQARPQDSIKCFERAIFLDRAAVVARYHLAQVCVQLDDPRRALTQLHLVKEMHGDYPPVYVLQGEIQCRLGDYRQAILEFQKAIELGVGDASVYWQLGQAHLGLSGKDKALRAFLQVLEHDPAHAAARFKTAELQEELRRYAQAQQHYHYLLEVEEYSEAAQLGLARIAKVLAEIASTLSGDEGGEPPA
jgi:tetratricopeptide (TPR) repeat protein